MSLKRLRDHCSRMAETEHKDDCPMLTAKETYWDPWVPDGDSGGLTWRGQPMTKWKRPTCAGCNPESDRALFRQIADEISAHLGDQLVLFGEDASA